MSSIGHAPTPHLKRIMIFIDGGYFRNILPKYSNIDPQNDPKQIAKFIEAIPYRIENFLRFQHSRLETIRIYYYDGIVLPSDQNYNKNEQFFKDIKSNCTPKIPFELKYGRLIDGGKGKYRQKGVDVLLSIDLVVKAFQDHFDLAMLVAGDDDFVDAVKIVKDFTGKRIIGLYKPEETSSRLIDSLDYKLPLLPEPFFKDISV